MKKIPFFLFLLPLFFCLHGSVEDYGFVEPGEVMIVGLQVTAFMAILLLIVYLFARNLLLAALISFFMALWYLFFGAIYDWVKSKPFLFFIHRYPFFLPVLVAATAGWIIYLHLKRASHSRWTFYLNLLMLIYCTIDGFMLLNKYLDPGKITAEQVSFDEHKVISKPNVYYLLFDEYPGYKSLRDSFGFANDSFYGFLQQSGFRMLPVFSNYDMTTFCMSAVLNMHYIDSEKVPLGVSQHAYQLRLSEIGNGEVFGIFKKMGYRFQNYSIFDIGEQHGVSTQNAFLPAHAVLLTDKILHNRLIRTARDFFLDGRLATAGWRKKYLYQHEVNNQYSLQKVLESAAEKNTVPKFCYAHFMMPHGPFYRDSMGNSISYQVIAYESWQSNKALFLSYLKYTNTIIESMVDSITKNDPGAIVVVMSDHGFRTYKNAGTFEPLNYDIICAVRLPGNNYLPYKESWSSVNFFRYLFNTAFGQNIPYLQDSTIYVNKHLPG